MSKSNKKICFITTVHHAYDTRIYFKEILSLVKAGYFINYIVKENSFNTEVPNIKLYPLPNRQGIWNRLKNVFIASKLAIQLNSRIYHFHDPELIILGLILKIFYRKVVIYDIHEIHFDEIKHKPYLLKPIALIISAIYQLIELIATKIFDKNILSETMYRNYYKGDNFLVVQNFILSKYIIEEKQVVKESANELNIVYIGSITEIRGIFEIINFATMIKALPNVTIHLIGPFDAQGLEKKVRELINHRDLNHMFKIYGRLHFPQAHAIARKCDLGLIFLHPILNNLTILPTKLFEYMGNGLAVIMSNFPLWVQFNENYQCGLTIDIFNLTRQKSGLLEFLSNKDKMNKIKQRNLNTVREKFVWEIEEKKLLNLYSQLVL